MKKLLIHVRSWVKVISLIFIASMLIIAGFTFIYKPTYSVTLNGEFIGYTKNKSSLQSKINDYIDNGDGENIAFVQVDDLPEYSLCLLKKDIQTNVVSGQGHRFTTTNGPGIRCPKIVFYVAFAAGRINRS